MFRGEPRCLDERSRYGDISRQEERHGEATGLIYSVDEVSRVLCDSKAQAHEWDPKPQIIKLEWKDLEWFSAGDLRQWRENGPLSTATLNAQKAFQVIIMPARLI